MHAQLGETEWLAGDELTIADFATWPWILGRKKFGVDIADYPHVGRWNEAMKARPATRRGVNVLKDARDTALPHPDHWDTLFGDKQYQRR